MDEIVRRLRSRNKKDMNYLKESMSRFKMDESDEEEDDEDDIPEDDLIDDTEDLGIDDEDTTEEESEDTEDDKLDPEDPDALDNNNSEKENANPLDNPYAVNYKLGDPVVLSYANGTKSKLEGIIDGYDKEGFYRIRWNSGMTTNGITDIALADIVNSIEESKCVCGGKKFINESNKMICDRCGRVLKEFKDPLSVADRSRPKDSRLVRSEAHPVNTSAKPDISESIKKAFKKSSIKEDYRDFGIFASLFKLNGEFWGRLPELKEDIEDLGYNVDEINQEYVVVSTTDDEDNDYGLLIPIVGTSRTMTLDFDRSRKV